MLVNFLANFLLRNRSVNRDVIAYTWILFEAAYLSSRDIEILKARKNGLLVSAISVEQLEMPQDIEKAILDTFDYVESNGRYPVVGRFGRLEGKGLNIAALFGDDKNV